MSAVRILRRHLGKIVLSALLVAGLAWLVPAVLAAREAARRSHCKNNLKQIELALHNYHDVYGSFPPAITYGPGGQPWHSWRVLISPFLESSPFYAQYSFDEPWNGPNNRRLAERYNPKWIYGCPTDAESPPEHTSYVAVVGDGTMWPPDGVASLDDVTDERSLTLLVVEVSDSGVHWMEPADLRLDAMSFEVSPAKGAGIRSHHAGARHWFAADEPNGANVGLVGGWVRFLEGSTPAETVREMLMTRVGKPPPVGDEEKTP